MTPTNTDTALEKIAVNWFMSEITFEKRIELANQYFPEYAEDNTDLDDCEILSIYLKEVQPESPEIFWWDGLNESGKIYAISTNSRCSLDEARVIWNDCQGQITDEKIKEIYLSNKYDIDNPSKPEPLKEVQPPTPEPADLMELNLYNLLHTLKDGNDVLLKANSNWPELLTKLKERLSFAMDLAHRENKMVEKLEGENESIKRLLHDLTPGGSEFYNDPEYCAKFIRDTRQETHYTMTGIIAEKKKENEALKERVKQLEAALGKISNCFGLTLGKADAGKFTRIAKAALQVTTIK